MGSWPAPPRVLSAEPFLHCSSCLIDDRPVKLVFHRTASLEESLGSYCLRFAGFEADASVVQNPGGLLDVGNVWDEAFSVVSANDANKPD